MPEAAWQTSWVITEVPSRWRQSRMRAAPSPRRSTSPRSSNITLSKECVTPQAWSNSPVCSAPRRRVNASAAARSSSTVSYTLTVTARFRPECRVVTRNVSGIVASDSGLVTAVGRDPQRGGRLCTALAVAAHRLLDHVPQRGLIEDAALDVHGHGGIRVGQEVARCSVVVDALLAGDDLLEGDGSLARLPVVLHQLTDRAVLDTDVQQDVVPAGGARQVHAVAGLGVVRAERGLLSVGQRGLLGAHAAIAVGMAGAEPGMTLPSSSSVFAFNSARS